MKDLQKNLNQAVSYFQKKDYIQAEKIFKRLLRKFPSEHSLYTYLIPCLIYQNKYSDALDYAKKFHQYETMLEISSMYMGIINSFLSTDHEKSLEYLDISLSFNPKNYHTLVNKAAILIKLDNIEEAKDLLDKAILIDDKNATAHRNYASIYEKELQFKKVKEFYLNEINRNKNDHESIYALSQIQLSEGNYDQGWANYEHRWLRGKLTYRYQNTPKLNDLLDIKGKKILIWHEQGFGDTIQFSRYVRRLILLGANITFEVQKPLVNFLKNQFNCDITDDASKKSFDYQSPLLGLPLLFGNYDKNFEFIGPYFQCSIEKLTFWKSHLELSKKKLNLGITISGNKKQTHEYRRRIDLSYFLKFLEYCKIYLIQKDINDDEKKIVKQNLDLLYLGNDVNWEDFTDSSAIIQNMDYIISIDTSIIHLAGSLNKDSLLLLSKPAEWRWTQEDKTTPKWYDSVKILRQKKIKNWSSIEDDLEKIIKNRFINHFELGKQI